MTPNEPAAPEAPRRRFRKLRIAWSVGFGLIGVLLLILWVRSYSVRDSAYTRKYAERENMLSSADGLIYYFTSDARGKRFSFPDAYLSHEHLGREQKPNAFLAFPGFSYHNNPTFGCTISVPHWSGVLLVTALTVAPWVLLIKRFSLRTLLIATTLVAVILGLIVWLR
jgi:hypothetical protein